MTAIFKKTVSAVVVAATLGGTVIATSSPASAAHWGHHGYHGGGYHGGAVAAGVLGALAVGAIAAGAAASAPRECWIERRPVVNRFGTVISYRRIRVCN